MTGPFGHGSDCIFHGEEADAVSLLHEGKPVRITFARRLPSALDPRSPAGAVEAGQWRIVRVSTRASITERWRTTHLWQQGVVEEAIARWRKGYWPCDACGKLISRSLALRPDLEELSSG